MNFRIASDKDLPSVRRLLDQARLPVDIIDERKGTLWVLEAEGNILASGAFEFHGTDALLRSVVITDAIRGTGIGTMMVENLEREAKRHNVKTIWLLTETADRFFEKRGYEKTTRESVINKGILDSAEFRHLCASTAVCMVKRLA